VVVQDAPADGGVYDAAVLAIGFGYELMTEGEDKSYWTDSPLLGSIRSKSDHILLVSGNGDGGLVDFMMAAFDGMPHKAYLGSHYATAWVAGG
jgi:hypothetical protein